ncbi:hypothetical protein IW261DRAFT_1564114 [Armillaria novae-zelandiae]|uniref:Uncharacterized protein n=1 Tax=Armillaria novae-zelandiae TaxID=153914 RepID=A0AA39P8D1_9AGAR|nr:hypothetical protein IW261DRAFT_1564114 [Armillaria novae-zelandiae]
MRRHVASVSSHNTPKHPIASFARDLVFSCKNIASKLPASAQLDSFNQWGLCMSELTGRATLSETTSVPKVFAAKPSTVLGQKRCASILEAEGGPADEHSSAEDGDGEFESEDAPRPKSTGGKGKAMAKPMVRGGASSAITKGLRSGSLAIVLPSRPSKKAAKTQPGSVKDEPIPSLNLLRKTPATKSSHVSAGASSISEHPTVIIKNKKHLVLKAHIYEKDDPVPIKAEELDAITQAAALPSYGCAQCSSSVQNQPCLFLGWGKQCNNCEAASKSLCTFRAEPVQRYFAHKELAQCVEATPRVYVRTCIDRTSAALHVFESSANATANAARLFRACFEELSEVCAHASSSEGRALFLAWFSKITTLKTESTPLSIGSISPVCQPADVIVLISRANEAIQSADTLWKHKAGVGLETIINQCKTVCGIGSAELVIQHPTTIIGDPKVEDAVFHMKQVFERIQAEHLTTPTFKDYHTVRSFTGLQAAALHLLCLSYCPSTAKTVATSGKGKATKVPASIVVAAEEDTVMGNLDASSAPPETDPMNIDDELEIIVNRDPSSGNIVEGHKIPFPKFLKNKKAALAAQGEGWGNTWLSRLPRLLSLVKKAYEAANQARKRPCSSADFAFKDSSYTIAAADVAINNEASQSTLDTAMALVSTADHVNPSENVLRSWEADLRNDVIATTHKIEYLLKYREFVVAHHAQVVQQLESRISVPMEDTPSTLVASSSKLD